MTDLNQTRIFRTGMLAAKMSDRLYKATEIVVVVLLAILVGMVWLGIAVRYVIDLPITFTEEASRYLMIWVALLAISMGIARRAHIGVLTVFDRLGERMRRTLLLFIDLLAFTFFMVLFVHSFGVVEKGWGRVTMIFFIPKSIPFFILPIASALAAIQIVLCAARDQFTGQFEPSSDQSAI